MAGEIQTKIHPGATNRPRIVSLLYLPAPSAFICGSTEFLIANRTIRMQLISQKINHLLFSNSQFSPLFISAPPSATSLHPPDSNRQLETIRNRRNPIRMNQMTFSNRPKISHSFRLLSPFAIRPGSPSEPAEGQALDVNEGRAHEVRRRAHPLCPGQGKGRMQPPGGRMRDSRSEFLPAKALRSYLSRRLR